MTFAARRARRIVTISEFSLGEIQGTLAPTCPVTIVSAHPAPRQPENQPESGPLTLLTVGALRGYKGLETVIEALSRLVAAGEEPPHVICVGAAEGNDGYREELADCARRSKVDGCFELVGWLPDEELRDLLGRCSGTINPSSYEGYGLPVAESLAAGLPTIASDIPPHREIAGDAALYFEPGDAAALADLLGRLGREPSLRDDLAQRAAQRSRGLAETATGWAEALLGEAPTPFTPTEGRVALATSR